MKIVKCALVLLCVLSAGCQLAGLLTPDPRPVIEAKYKLTKGKKVAVLVDDYMCPVSDSELKRSLAQKINQGFMDAGVLRAGDLVGTEQVEEIPKDTAQGKKVSIQKIGEQVQADYVVYVNIIDFSIQSDPDNPLVQPKARAYVKVIEVATGERLWPIDLAGEPVEVTGRLAGELVSENTDARPYTESLSDDLAAEIVGLFFEHRKGK